MNTVLPLADFDQVDPATLEATLDQHIKTINQAIEAVCAEEQPTWANTIAKLDEAFDALNSFWSPVSHLNAVKQSEALRNAYEPCIPKLSELYTRMGQNEALFSVYQSLADSDEYLQYSPAQKATIKKALRDFELSGVALPAEKKAQFATLSSELSQLANQFSNNVLDATQAWYFHTDKVDDLAGIPDSALALFEQQAQARSLPGYVVTLDFPCYFPVLQFADNRELRQAVYRAYATRASALSQDLDGQIDAQFDNTQIMKTLLEKRQALAQLLDFDNFAELSLAKKMATNVPEVMDFLSLLADKSRTAAEQEFAELCAFAKELDGIADLQAWDMSYYSEKLKEQRYSLNQEQVKAYFPYPKVVSGLFSIVSKLFALRIEADESVATYHEDVCFYRVFDQQNTLIAGFYLDPYARQQKRGGAWMNDFSSRHQTSNQLQLPVAYLTCNFTPPVGEQPALLTHDEVTTLFHEFGHGLHHMLTQINVSDVAGISGVEWDAVELPSQLMENWCWEPEGLALISSHVETGEPLPADLLNQMLAAKNYHSAMMMVRQLEFSLFDMRLHAEDPQAEGFDVEQVLAEVRAKVSVVPAPEFNRFANSFSHIFAGGYAAGYYSYKWAEVLSADFFTVFKNEGIFNQATGQRYLDSFLAQGSVDSAASMCEKFLGRSPDVEALLKQEGILAA